MVIFAAGRTESDASRGRKSHAGSSSGKSVQLVHGMRPRIGISDDIKRKSTN
jgi:hypothetical protein